MDQKWVENRSKTYQNEIQKWVKSGPKIWVKSTEIRPKNWWIACTKKNHQNWPENEPEIDRIWTEMGDRNWPKLTEIGHEIDRKWSEIGSQIRRTRTRTESQPESWTNPNGSNRVNHEPTGLDNEAALLISHRVTLQRWETYFKQEPNANVNIGTFGM